MKIYKYGVVCCAIYFLYSAPFLIWTSFFGHDPKGEYVMMQIALMPALLLFMCFRLIDLIASIPWLNNHLTFYLLNFLLAYLIGSALEFTIAKRKERRMAEYVEDRRNMRAKRSNDF